MSSPAVAEELIALADSLPAAQARAPALLALSILEHHLYARQDSPLSPSAAIALELRISQVLFRYTGETSAAETTLARLSSKIGTYEEFTPLRIEASALLAQIMQQSGQTRAAIKALEHSANLAAERNLFHLQYSSLLQSYHLSQNPELLRTLMELAQQRGHVDFGRYIETIDLLAQLHKRRGSALPSAHAAVPTELVTLLDLISLTAQTSRNIVDGNCVAALPKLKQIHSRLDTHPWPTSQTLTLAPGQTLTLSWLDKEQGFALVSLLSALVHVGDLISHRAPRFLQSGFKQLPLIRDTAWRSRMHVALLKTAVTDHLARQQLEQAAAGLEQLRQITGVTPTLQFLQASLSQAQGKLEEALPVFLHLARQLQSRQAEEPSLSVLAGLCAILILRSTTVQHLHDPSEAASLLNMVQPFCTGPLTALLDLVTAADSPLQREQPLMIRNSLTQIIGQAARQCNTDFKMLALTLLASNRNGTDPPDAKRQFAQAAYGLAARQSQEVSAWALLNGQQLEKAFEAGGMTQQATQQHEMNDRIRAVLAQRGQLTTKQGL